MKIRKYIGFFAAVCLLFISGACSHDGAQGLVTPDTEGYGTLDISSIRGSLATRAQSVDDYMIIIERLSLGSTAPVPQPVRYGDCGGEISLAIGRYGLRVVSPEVELPGWDKPTYEGRVDEFTILANQRTDVGTVICHQNNLKVTVRFGDGLWSVIDHNVAVTVTVDGKSLSFDNGALGNGYFEVVEPCEMTVSLTGSIPEEGWSGTVTQTASVSPGDWQRVRFALPDDSEFPIIIVEKSEAGQLGDGDAW